MNDIFLKKYLLHFLYQKHAKKNIQLALLMAKALQIIWFRYLNIFQALLISFRIKSEKILFDE